jgi:hypothetical protein
VRAVQFHEVAARLDAAPGTLGKVLDGLLHLRAGHGPCRVEALARPVRGGDGLLAEQAHMAGRTAMEELRAEERAVLVGGLHALSPPLGVAVVGDADRVLPAAAVLSDEHGSTDDSAHAACRPSAVPLNDPGRDVTALCRLVERHRRHDDAVGQGNAAAPEGRGGKEIIKAAHIADTDACSYGSSSVTPRAAAPRRRPSVKCPKL